MQPDSHVVAQSKLQIRVNELTEFRDIQTPEKDDQWESTLKLLKQEVLDWQHKCEQVIASTATGTSTIFSSILSTGTCIDTSRIFCLQLACHQSPLQRVIRVRFHCLLTNTAQVLLLVSCFVSFHHLLLAHYCLHHLVAIANCRHSLPNRNIHLLCQPSYLQIIIIAASLASISV